MVMFSIQEQNYDLYFDCKTIEEYEERLEKLIEKVCKISDTWWKVNNCSIWLDEAIFGVDLSKAANRWNVESAYKISDFRNEIREWLMNHREKS